MPQQQQPPKKNPPPRDLRMGVGQVFPTFTPDYEALRTPLDPTPLAVTNPVLAQALDFLGGLTGFKDALVPTSSGATVAGAGLGAMLPLAALGSLKKLGTAAKMAEATPTPIRAYHGSPHDFDRFSLSKIGTGEGAQAYGHGLYFGEASDVGRNYRDMVPGDLRGRAGHEFDANIRIGTTPIEDVYRRLDTSAARMPIAQAQANYDKMEILESLMHHGDVLAVREARKGGSFTPEAMQWFEKDIAPKFSRKGRLYEVNLHASPDEFLDWDKPLSQQPKAVQELMKEVQTSPGLISVTDADGTARHYQLGGDRDRMTGAGLYSALGKLKGGDQAAASEAMRKAGIKGIRYADEGSRGKKNFVVGLTRKSDNVLVQERVFSTQQEADEFAKSMRDKGMDASVRNEGTSNFVVFDDAIIAIMKKYGVGITTAGAILENQRRQDEQKRGRR